MYSLPFPNYCVLFKVITFAAAHAFHNCETNISRLSQLKIGFKWSMEVAIKLSMQRIKLFWFCFQLGYRKSTTSEYVLVGFKGAVSEAIKTTVEFE